MPQTGTFNAKIAAHSFPLRSMKSAPAGRAATTREINHRFYDALWREARLIEPSRFNTWPLVCALARNARRRLEVAPGLRPRLPIEDTHFVDLSEAAARGLRDRGARVSVASVTALPFNHAHFDLVCAFDIVEHIEEEDGAWLELSRVCARGAALLTAVPLHPSRWSAFDEMVGHCRRYEPRQLLGTLNRHGFAVESSAVFGMQPRSPWLLAWGMWWLSRHRERAMQLYNQVLMPLGVRLQRKLSLQPGMIDVAQVDEVLLVCRKRA